jgi:1,4-dihydroxy-6-naphthoate synthase
MGSQNLREIKVAHSPDSDDAFMFYALAKDKIDTGDLKFTHVLEGIESLNRRAFNTEFDVTAISFHAYAYLADKYILLPSGASMGDRYGPMVIAKEQLTIDDLKNKTIAIPGTMTTAFLALKLLVPEFKYEVVDFDKIIDTVVEGRVDAGLIIHEGQLTYAQSGLKKIVDLGEWWCERTGLPLPLGGNVIRRDLEPELINRVSDLLKESIQYALDHRQDALAYALQFARDMDEGLADKFVGMYVNEMTLDYGEAGRTAVRLLLEEGYKAGIIPHKVDVQFV